MKKIIYIIDNTSKIKFIQKINKFNPDQIFLIALTQDKNKINLFLEKLQNISTTTILPFMEKRQVKSLDIRESYINFISTLSNKLEIFFKFPNKDFSFWDLSIIEEKKPHKSNTYLTIVEALTILDLIKETKSDILFLNINKSRLIKTLKNNLKKTKIISKRNYYYNFIYLKSFAMAVYAFLDMIFKYSIMLKYKNKLSSPLQKSSYLFLSDFPENKKTKSVFEPIQKYIKPKETIGILFSSNQGTFFEFKRKLKNIFLSNSSTNIDILERYLNLKMLFKAIVYYSILSAKAIKTFKTFKNQLIFNNYKISNCLISDYFYSFCGHTCIYNIFYILLFKSAFKNRTNPCSLLYLCEMQPQEKALNITIKNKQISSFAIVHIPPAKLMLNYNVYFKNKNIYPDFLLCPGINSAENFLQLGWPKNKIQIWGAMRFQYLKNKKPIESSSDKFKILIALPGSNRNSKELLLLLQESLKELPSIQVIIKQHPAFSLEKYKWYKNLKNKFEFSNTNKPLGDLLDSKTIFISCNSAAVFEALYIRCPIIIPALTSNVNLDPLFGNSNFAYFTNSSQELYILLKKIIDNKIEPFSKENTKNFLDENIKLLKNEEDYLDLWYTN
jgi:hypothetical protein